MYIRKIGFAAATLLFQAPEVGAQVIKCRVLFSKYLRTGLV